MRSFTTLALLATAVASVFSAAVEQPPEKRSVTYLASLEDIDVPIAASVQATDAYKAFLDSPVVLLTEANSKRQDSVIPDFVFVLQCTDDGFRGNCLVFGAPPGTCVSYFDFDPSNSTEISDVYNDAVSSISTNTGGAGQFYLYEGCDKLGNDRGLTVNYNYNLAVGAPGDPRTVEYENLITSWRC